MKYTYMLGSFYCAQKICTKAHFFQECFCYSLNGGDVSKERRDPTMNPWRWSNNGLAECVLNEQ